MVKPSTDTRINALPLGTVIFSYVTGIATAFNTEQIAP
jgi:hypothetical protein